MPRKPAVFTVVKKYEPDEQCEKAAIKEICDWAKSLKVKKPDPPKPAA